MIVENKTASIFHPDRILQTTMHSLIRARSYQHELGISKSEWKPGNPLKLLFAGYSGTRNTGADVRVEEMIRQVRHLLGDKNLELSILTIDPAQSARYFKTVKQVRLPQIFPQFLYQECPKHHGVIACEGSMFKSKFADALSTMMAGSLGMASSEGKISIGYGAEAGQMTPHLSQFVRKVCKDSFIICRNEPSREILEALGIRTESGTDTAWTFESAPLEIGHQHLVKAGWDGKLPILLLCPINPFWWPVKPDLWKATAHKLLGEYKDTHYKSVYFHEYGVESRKKYQRYIQAFAKAVKRFQSETPCFPVLIGMERLDREACHDLRDDLGHNYPTFISDTYDIYDLVSILRNGRWMLSSRFHAIVCSMPAQVASAGITMDERIRNLMNDRGQEHLFAYVDDENLEEKVFQILQTLRDDEDEISHGIGKTVPKQLKLMSSMGQSFLDEVERIYPNFPLETQRTSWEQYLPPLGRVTRSVLETYA